MVKNIIRNSRLLFKLALEYRELKLNKNDSALSSEELQYLQQLEENGVAVIPNFFSEEECQILIDDFENIDKKYAKLGEDKRIFGIEHLSESFKKLFHDNQMFKNIGKAYLGDEVVLQTTMAAKIEPKEGEIYGSGGCWHRDSFSRQFKAIVYLDDVEIDNGPFMYVHGSHKMKNIKKVIDGLDDHSPGNYRYTDKEFEKCKDILGEDITYYTAPKGTLLLADIRGLHTGMPIKKGHRYTIFNYYIAKSSHQPNNIIEQLAQKNLDLKNNENL